MQNILTIDIEDWQQSTLDNALPVSPRVRLYTGRFLDILKNSGVRATLFIQGMVAEQFPELVQRAIAEGHEIASHSYAHRAVYRMGKEEFAHDLKKSITILEDISHTIICGFRAPDFSITERSLWALEILRQHGIQYDSSIFPVKNPRYGISEFTRFPHCMHPDHDSLLWEFPLSTLRFVGVNIPFAGGGYFRLYPYWIIKWGIRKLNRQGIPAVLYFHPYELAPEEFNQIERHVPLKLKMTQGLNRSQTASKLKALLKDFSFIPVCEYLKSKK